MMVIIPTYASIGILAPIAVLLARLLQGFAVAVGVDDAETLRWLS